MGDRLVIWPITSLRLAAPMTLTPSTTDASLALTPGTMISLKPSFLAKIATDNTPFECLKEPSKDISPTISRFSGLNLQLFCYVFRLEESNRYSLSLRQLFLLTL